MRRREFMLGAAMAAAADGARAQDPAAARRSPDYSESVAFVLFSADGLTEISARLQRRPGRREGILWAGMETPERAYGVAQTIEMAPGAVATAVEAPTAVFRERGAWDARFERGAGANTVRLSAMAHPSADPPTQEGSIPFGLEARFTPWHPPQLVRPGRLEGFGLAEAVVTLPEGRRTVSGFGKWHEQTGERARFAPAFTYMAISGPQTGLLAVKSGAGAYGFALKDGVTTAVKSLEIGPIGPVRAFRAVLADGRTVAGTATTLRTTSVPIEGTRRPSASVLVETDLGAMVGHINDWNPPA